MQYLIFTCGDQTLIVIAAVVSLLGLLCEPARFRLEAPKTTSSEAVATTRWFTRARFRSQNLCWRRQGREITSLCVVNEQPFDEMSLDQAREWADVGSFGNCWRTKVGSFEEPCTTRQRSPPTLGTGRTKSLGWAILCRGHVCRMWQSRPPSVAGRPEG